MPLRVTIAKLIREWQGCSSMRERDASLNTAALSLLHHATACFAGGAPPPGPNPHSIYMGCLLLVRKTINMSARQTTLGCFCLICAGTCFLFIFIIMLPLLCPGTNNITSKIKKQSCDLLDILRVEYLVKIKCCIAKLDCLTCYNKLR